MSKEIMDYTKPRFIRSISADIPGELWFDINKIASIHKTNVSDENSFVIFMRDASCCTHSERHLTQEVCDARFKYLLSLLPKLDNDSYLQREIEGMKEAKLNE